MINQILTEIDGVGARKSVFVIGATNRPDILDPAVTRPGRFDQLVYIPMPDFDARLSIFGANLRKSPIAPDVNVSALAAATEGLSGADIAEICQRAAKNAVLESVETDRLQSLNGKGEKKDFVPFIRSDHFQEALKRARRSISEEDLQHYEIYRSKMKAQGIEESRDVEDFPNVQQDDMPRMEKDLDDDL